MIVPLGKPAYEVLSDLRHAECRLSSRCRRLLDLFKDIEVVFSYARSRAKLEPALLATPEARRARNAG